jgi:hypothetical protein
MGSGDILLRGTETKLFDPHDDPASKGTEVLDASVVRRGDRWWMYLAGQRADAHCRKNPPARLTGGFCTSEFSECLE